MELTREKRVYTTTVAPFFLGLSPDPEVTEQKKLWSIPFSWETREKGIHHRSGKKGIHHRASDTEKEKKKGLAFGVFPLSLLSAITACGGPEDYFSLAIIAFGAFDVIVPKYYCRLGKKGNGGV